MIQPRLNMLIWRHSIVFCTSCIIHLFVCAFSTREKQYTRQSTYDNMSCKQSDIIMTANLSNSFGCLIYSMGRRCGTVFYNPSTEDCIGCSSVYINTDHMTYEDGTTAYEFQFECAAGDWKFSTSCYHLLAQTSWENAKTQCSTQKHSYLAVPDSDEENSFMTSVMHFNDNISSVHIGISDIETEAIFINVHGHGITYSNWAIGEPNNIEGDEHCVELQYSGEWNDAICDYRYKSYALCETEMIKD